MDSPETEPPSQAPEGLQAVPPAPRSVEVISPQRDTSKGVTIAEIDQVVPVTNGHSKSTEDSEEHSPKQHRAKVGRRLTGRLPSSHSNTSLEHLTDQLDLHGIGQESLASGSNRAHSSLLSQVHAWLHEEKQKLAARRAKRKQGDAQHPATEVLAVSAQDGPEDESRSTHSTDNASIALEKLEQILTANSSTTSLSSRRPSLKHRRSSKARRLRRQSSGVSLSDTENSDMDLLVPSCDVVLDNSKTIGYTGGTSKQLDDDVSGASGAIIKGREAWHQFKYEIVRLAHTLKLKGWRRVPLERSSEIEVERLSGALTNAVYVVAPPKDVGPTKPEVNGAVDSSAPSKPPPKLLLRIYGPQVEHLIDREAELLILRRLAKKSIGPRLLGTFANGRFEQFFHARTLTAHDLRVPETSRQIAKRMKELHEGIQLLEEERNGGPFIWKNWDKWVKRVGEVSSWLDRQITSNKSSAPCSAVEAWRKRGFVCGVQWPVFQNAVNRYRNWLNQQYGGPLSIRAKLVFAHNDTQYGNILRLEPAESSSLLHPTNEHKQLIVIDFEYANANLPGLEFANHFTEWCYNYHDASAPWRCNTSSYPTPEEQRRFIRAYVRHRPQFSAPATTMPKTYAANASSTSLPALSLDRTTSQTTEEDAQLEKGTELEVERLMLETRLWRIANSAQWVAWGIVQAKVPGMPADTQLAPPALPDHSQQIKAQQHLEPNQATDPLDDEAVQMKQDLADRRPEADDATGAAVTATVVDGHADGEEEFDYLAYAHDRALFFWGDMLQVGLVRKEELPGELVRRVKVVEY